MNVLYQNKAVGCTEIVPHFCTRSQTISDFLDGIANNPDCSCRQVVLDAKIIPHICHGLTDGVRGEKPVMWRNFKFLYMIDVEKSKIHPLVD